MPSVAECLEEPGSLAGLGCPQNNTKLPTVQFPALKANKLKGKQGWRELMRTCILIPRTQKRQDLVVSAVIPVFLQQDQGQRWENPQNYGPVILVYPDANKRPCLKQEAKRSLTPEVVF